MKWVTSDHHFGHERIIELERPQFKSLTEMNNFMIEKWNSVVAQIDTVYHLGDFALGLSEEEMTDLMNSLNGNIILIRGNHDRMGKKKLINFGFVNVVNRIEIGSCILTHKPIQGDLLGDKINVHGHTHTRNLESEKHINVSVEQTEYLPIKLELLMI